MLNVVCVLYHYSLMIGGSVTNSQLRVYKVITPELYFISVSVNVMSLLFPPP